MTDVPVRGPRIRHAVVVIVVTALIFYGVSLLGKLAPAFGTFIHMGELVVLISGAITLWHTLRPRRHERRHGDRRHADRRRASR